MGIADIARRVLPANAVASIARSRKKARRSKIEKLPKLSEADFIRVLVDDLGIARNDTVYVGSSIDQLNLDFPFYRILALAQDVIGRNGNLLFPNYPNRSPISSYKYLLHGNVFDVRRTPSFTGILSEFARRQKGAVRSLHPTKSVCAIGPDAKELTQTNRISPYPYDKGTPYYRLIECGAKIIGLGIWTEYLSFGYTIDDALKANPPVLTYHPQIFAARCINYDGEEEIVETLADNMKNVVHDAPHFMKEYIPAEICSDISVKGMRFFRADAKRLFDEMLRLAKAGITVYPRRLYNKKFLKTLD